MFGTFTVCWVAEGEVVCPELDCDAVDGSGGAGPAPSADVVAALVAVGSPSTSISDIFGRFITQARTLSGYSRHRPGLERKSTRYSVPLFL